MVDAEEHHGFYKLGLNGRAPHGDNGLAGEDRRALGDGPNITGKFKVPQIVQKLPAEDMLGMEILNVLLCKAQVLQIVHQLLHPCHNGKAAVIRHLAEEHVKIADGVLIAVGKVSVRHRQLVKIGQHGQVGFLVAFVHVHTPSVFSPA